MTVETVDAGPRKISRRVVVDAPASVLFEQLANPHKHAQIDGSGTVGDATKGPDTLAQGDTFSVKMKQFGLPYKITSKVVAFEQDRLIEWKHPAGHTWRWELVETKPGTTQVTETWDASRTPAFAVYKVSGMTGRNEKGIEATLEGLRTRYAQ